MSILIPPELQWVSYLAGQKWPQGREDEMFDLADIWKTKAQEIAGIVPDLVGARDEVTSSLTGDAAEAAKQNFALLLQGDTSIDALAEGMAALGELAYKVAGDIESTKIEILVDLAIAAADITAAIVDAVWSFGTSLLWIPVFEAIAIISIRLLWERLIRWVAEKVAETLAKTSVRSLAEKLAREVAEEIFEEVAIDLSIQEYQLEKGHRHEFDPNRLGNAAIGGAVGGGVGAAVGGPLRKLFGEGNSVLGRAFGHGFAGYWGEVTGDAAAAAALGGPVSTDTLFAGGATGGLSGGLHGAAEGPRSPSDDLHALDGPPLDLTGDLGSKTSSGDRDAGHLAETAGGGDEFGPVEEAPPPYSETAQSSVADDPPPYSAGDPSNDIRFTSAESPPAHNETRSTSSTGSSDETPHHGGPDATEAAGSVPPVGASGHESPNPTTGHTQTPNNPVATSGGPAARQRPGQADAPVPVDAEITQQPTTPAAVTGPIVSDAPGNSNSHDGQPAPTEPGEAYPSGDGHGRTDSSTSAERPSASDAPSPRIGNQGTVSASHITTSATAGPAAGSTSANLSGGGGNLVAPASPGVTNNGAAVSNPTGQAPQPPAAGSMVSASGPAPVTHKAANAASSEVPVAGAQPPAAQHPHPEIRSGPVDSRVTQPTADTGSDGVRTEDIVQSDGSFGDITPELPMPEAALATLVDGVPPQIPRDASFAQCGPLANWLLRTVYPSGLTGLASTDDVVVDRGGVGGAQGRVVAGATWAQVGDRRGLLDTVSARPGSTAVVMVSRPNGRVGHVLALHATTDGIRWVDPQRPASERVRSTTVYGGGMPPEVTSAPTMHAVVVDRQGHVLEPGTWAGISPMVDALLDADITRRFGAYEDNDSRTGRASTDDLTPRQHRTPGAADLDDLVVQTAEPSGSGGGSGGVGLASLYLSLDAGATSVDARRFAEIEDFVSRVVAVAVQRREAGGPGLVLQVQGGGNGGKFSRGADSVGRERARSVVSEIAPRVARALGGAGIPADFVRIAEPTSRGRALTDDISGPDEQSRRRVVVAHLEDDPQHADAAVDDGDGWVVDAAGAPRWGRYGAAGLLLRAQNADGVPVVLLQHRAQWSHHGGSWGLPGGARSRLESAEQAALRETLEETGLQSNRFRPRTTMVTARAPGIDWTYSTVIGDAPYPLRTESGAEGTHRWVPVDEVSQLRLHPGLADSWEALRGRLEAVPPMPPRPSPQLDPTIDPTDVEGVYALENPERALYFRDDTDLLYRQDTRPPEVVFEEGFAVRPDYRDYSKVTHFISTTRNPALVYLKPSSTERVFLYTIDAPGGIDLNKTVGIGASAYQQEVSFPGGIRRENIQSAVEILSTGEQGTDTEYGPVSRNRHFNPDLPNDGAPPVLQGPIGGRTPPDESIPTAPPSVGGATTRPERQDGPDSWDLYLAQLSDSSEGTLSARSGGRSVDEPAFDSGHADLPGQTVVTGSTHAFALFGDGDKELDTQARVTLDAFAIEIADRARQHLEAEGNGLHVRAEGGGNGGWLSRGSHDVGKMRADAVLHHLRDQIPRRLEAHGLAPDAVTVSSEGTSRGDALTDHLVGADDNAKRRNVVFTVEERVPTRSVAPPADGAAAAGTHSSPHSIDDTHEHAAALTDERETSDAASRSDTETDEVLSRLAAGDVVSLLHTAEVGELQSSLSTIQQRLRSTFPGRIEQIEADTTKMIELLERSRITINFSADQMLTDLVSEHSAGAPTGESSQTLYLNGWQRGAYSGDFADFRDEAEQITGQYGDHEPDTVGDSAETADARQRVKNYLTRESPNFRPAARPRYGALDYGQSMNGAAPGYGGSFFVLKEHVKHRATFTPSDSMQGDPVGSTVLGMAQLLARTREEDFRSIHNLATTGEGFERKKERIDPRTKADTNYLEAQLHTPIDFFRDIDAVSIDTTEMRRLPDTLRTEVAEALKRYAATYNVRLEIRDADGVITRDLNAPPPSISGLGGPVARSESGDDTDSLGGDGYPTSDSESRSDLDGRSEHDVDQRASVVNSRPTVNDAPVVRTREWSGGTRPALRISAATLTTLVDGVAPRLPQNASRRDCVPLTNWLLRRLYPNGLRNLTTADDSDLGRGGVAGAQAAVVTGPGWARVGDRDELVDLIKGSTGSTAVVMVSRRGGEVGHVLAVHATTDGLRWVDPQQDAGKRVSSPASHRDEMPPEVISAPTVWAAVIDSGGRVRAPGTWSITRPGVDALLDADTTREFGAPGDQDGGRGRPGLRDLMARRRFSRIQRRITHEEHTDVMGRLAAGDAVSLRREVERAEDRRGADRFEDQDGSVWASHARHRLEDVLGVRPESSRDAVNRMATHLMESRVTHNFRFTEWLDHHGEFLESGERLVSGWESNAWSAVYANSRDAAEREIGLYDRDRRLTLDVDPARASAVRDRISRYMSRQSELFRPAGRPHYGILDYANAPAGGARQYGHSFLVFRNHVKSRSTFTPMDSLDPGVAAQAATLVNLEKLLVHCSERNLRRIYAWAMHGRESGSVPPHYGVDYIETQIHSDIEFARDIEAIYIAESDLRLLDQQSAERAWAVLESIAEQCGIQLARI